jgi:hypothetical protein
VHHIDTLVWDISHHVAWRGTFIYGEPNIQNRHNMWEHIRILKPRSQALWLMIGDFNEAMCGFEHHSSRNRPERQMLDFREIVLHCDLHDLGFRGKPWTYDNKQAGERNVKVRLDRAVACTGWSAWFPGAFLQHITSSRSGHCPILLHVESREDFCTPQDTFQYEVMWEREKTLTEEIKLAWELENSVDNLKDIADSL